MKILVLDEEFPFPLNTGKRIRSFNLISRLARGNSVSYLAYGESDSAGFIALSNSGIRPVAVPPQVPAKSGPSFYMRLLANLFSRYPYIVTSHYSQIFAQKMQEIIDRERPDLILCEWTPYAIFVKDTHNIKKVIVAHNLEHKIWQRYFENESNPVKKWYIGRQMTKVERFEKEAFGWVDGATAVSSIEAAQIRSINPAAEVEVVENGVDLEYYDFPPGPVTKELVFVGSINWRPNQDAINYFVGEIFPLLRSKDKDITATFVGQDPPESIKKLGNISGVTIAGQVDDVRSYVQKAAVCIVPLRIGGGSRLKILEAFAMRKAVVSTTVGAEGLDVIDGQNILLADTPEYFTDKIITLIQDRELNTRLGHAGRLLAEEKYGWERLAVKLEQFLNRIMGRQ